LVQKHGANYVGNDFYLATAADIVADPSAPDAFVEGIMEGKEWVWDNGALCESEVNSWKRLIEGEHRTRLAETKANAFKKLLQNL